MKKRILFYLYSFSLGGGAERILANIIDALDADKYEAEVLDIVRERIGIEKTRKQIKVYRGLEAWNQPRLTRTLAWNIRKFFPALVKKVLVPDNYDIEVSFTVMNPPLPFSKRKGVLKIAYVHGSIENYKTQDKNRRVYEKFLTSADVIVAISKKTAESIIELYPTLETKVTTVYNGYNFEDMKEKLKEACPIEIEKPSLGVVGRLEKNKGIDRVIALAKKLKDSGEFIHFYLLGSGDGKDAYEAMVKKLNLEDCIHFLGYEVNTLKYLKDMDGYLSLSRQEGFSTALVEALYAGLPFISTDVGGAFELSDEGNNGIIINSVDEAQEAVLKVLGSKYDKEALKNFVLKFTTKNQIIDLERIFEYNGRKIDA